VAFFIPYSMNIASIYKLFCEANGVSTDSRNCPKGSLFFALKGASFNGNQYAEKALEDGASYAIVDEKVSSDKRCILVPNVLETLQKLANYHRRQLKTPIIGITGSNGKTTTKELLATALKSRFKLHYTQGNFNNHIGVPLTLLQLDKSHELAIVEMGANHPGEIAELAAIAEPNYGLITNIGKAHLAGFGGIEGVKKTKKELYDFIREAGGKVFVNAKDEVLMQLSEGLNRLLYNAEQSFFHLDVESAIPKLKLRVTSDGETDVLQTQLVGEYNVINLMVALELGHFWGIDYHSMKKVLEAYVPSNNRSQIVNTRFNTLILDAYNANPASMAVAVDNFVKLPDQHKVVMLGAMKELGEYSKQEHQHLVDTVSQQAFDACFMVGEEFNEISHKPKGILFFEDIKELKNHLKTAALKSSTVLIKGSRMMKMEDLVEFL